MASDCGVETPKSYCTQPRGGFLTPPPNWKARRCSPVIFGSEKKPRRSPPAKSDLFHVIHKVPSGDSPYVKAKHVQLIDKDPSMSISLFWAAINSGDRVDSALKDMAVVMKQLDRSDEAIEAIKSFRHLCPPDSQESIDNILIELYKQSGRVWEEIGMFQLKLKQVEEGLAFGGKMTKLARSQGKKVKITVEKEYSRLLGNIAWAYMQQKDFKSAEEHYRKALSFESDKNKQCNLAICLMNMNKLTEAKFLLQAIKVSFENGTTDERHAKSYERAVQMLADLESPDLPMKQNEHGNVCGNAREFADGHINRNDWKPFPVPLSVNKTSKGAFTGLPYEKVSYFDRRRSPYQLQKGKEEEDSSLRRAYDSPSCTRRIPKVPFTQPRRCSWSFNKLDRGNDARIDENARGGSCRKLFFEPFSNAERIVPKFLKRHVAYGHGDWSKQSFDKLGRVESETKQLSSSEIDEERMNVKVYYDQKNLSRDDCDLPSELLLSADCSQNREISDKDSSQSIDHSHAKDSETVNLWTGSREARGLKKTWADMVEEDEEELLWRSDLSQKNTTNTYSISHKTPRKFSVSLMDVEGSNDENVDSNIISDTPTALSQDEKLCQRIASIDLDCGYFTQPEKTNLSRNQSVKRSLFYKQNQKPATATTSSTSPLPTKALHFEGQDSLLAENINSRKSINLDNRKSLQIFRDITHVA